MKWRLSACLSCMFGDDLGDQQSAYEVFDAKGDGAAAVRYGYGVGWMMDVQGSEGVVASHAGSNGWRVVHDVDGSIGHWVC
ncbi:hypothetical protein LIA77_08269 [Sarocladium implicatum]|nr:hypothetical protein LIA77_08269 [Sarocladium implicatum]